MISCSLKLIAPVEQMRLGDCAVRIGSIDDIKHMFVGRPIEHGEEIVESFRRSEPPVCTI